MKYDKDKIKNSLTIEQVKELLKMLDAAPQQINSNTIICRTICHGGESHKLYYYDNTKLFRCYTECDSAFDIFELLIKFHETQGEKYCLIDAIKYVVNFFSLEDKNFINDSHENIRDWVILKRWEEKSQKEQEQKSNKKLNIYDEKILENLPKPILLNWKREGIKKEVCDTHGIKYDAAAQGIVIPHYDVDGRLVGIRERTLVKENEQNGKYRPAFLNNKIWNHPLGLNLYNLNFSKDIIKRKRKVIIFESEKSCLKFCSIFGDEEDFSVAVCGSNITEHQFFLLYDLGITEVIVAFDRQYLEAKATDKEWVTWTKKLQNIYYKYGKYVQVSFMFDKGYLLGYKDSPIDCGPDIFLTLYKKRIII